MFKAMLLAKKRPERTILREEEKKESNGTKRGIFNYQNKCLY